MPLIIPPLSEQAAIVRYLEYTDSRLRRYTANRRKMLSLLRERKQAVIQRAVTRGLDPGVRLKPSGMPWLGDVPAHWEVRRLKAVCRFAYGDALAADTRQEGYVPVYGSNGQVGVHNSSNTLAPCLVIGRKGSFGKIRYSEQAVFAIDTAFYIDARFTDSNLVWLHYVLGCLKLDSVSKDSAVPGLDRGEAYQQSIPLPPIPEQEAIVRYLAETTAGIDRAIAAIQRDLSLLQEYRVRLFADVVTGKMDVRAAVASLPEEVEFAPAATEAEELLEVEQDADGADAGELSDADD